MKLARPVFEKAALDRKECEATCAELTAKVLATINKLEFIKDNLTYTFPVKLKSEIERYFTAIPKNAAEEKRYAKQKAQYDKLVARGKEPDGQVVAAKITDLNKVREDHNYNYLIEVDGGINNETIVLAKNAGADVVVVGSYLMNSKDLSKTYEELRKV